MAATKISNGTPITPTGTEYVPLGNGSSKVIATAQSIANLVLTSGVLAVSKGGTGIGSYTAGDIVRATGATTLSKLALGTGLQMIRVNAGATDIEYFTPTFNPMTTIGDIIQGGASGDPQRLAAVATGNALISGGVATLSSWGKIGLTTHISGVLPVANGGTNIASYTTGDVLYASASGTLSALAAVAAGSYIRSAGTSTAPVWSTLILPNSATANRIAFATATNTWGESANLTFAAASGLGVTGSMTLSYVAKSGNYTLTATDYSVEVTSGTNTQTLPTAVGITGRIYVISNSGAGTVTIATTSSQTFVNVATNPTTIALAAVGSRTVQSNGANWVVIASV